MSIKDPAKLKAWKPVAYLLLAASVISAIGAISGLGERAYRAMFPSPAYPVITGIEDLNGYSEETLFPQLERHDGGFAFLSIQFNTFWLEPAKSFHEECREFEIAENGGKYVLKTLIGGTIKPYALTDQEYEIHCRTAYVTMVLNDRPKQNVGTNHEERDVIGLFKIDIEYLGTSPIHYYLTQQSLSPSEFGTLNSFALEQWRDYWEKREGV